ncbi:hypothetical protein FJD38_09915 [Pseudomonas saxonica]|uniref:Peptidase M60 domain-containing protein n=1 Tax=Pseudomonas saxonica TaxID=2600598 RepID=A0ABY3GHF1_9PSED|nr:hypothetical protein [Pseudomonas saxonica]TWR89834.1 hypothetical protein FJD38_09915 [Pseudomonas saxonica]
MLSRTDPEIYELANNVLAEITQNLTDGIYKQLHGSLSFGWATAPKFNAWAESDTVVGGPPQHKIVLHYELARLLYRDAEDFCSFASNEQTKRLIHTTFADDATALLPECFTLDDCIQNMFLGSLTWVYFHELGHLMQEHGRVRNNGSSASATTTIQELDAHAAQILTGRQASISHATELAADSEAITQCLIASARHFLKGPLVDEGDGAEVFIGSVYLLTCSLACIFYRFNAGSSPHVVTPITGSHPSPIYRLELSAPHIYELTELLLKASEFDGERRRLVSMTKQAADLGSFFWNYSKATGKDETIHLFVKGFLQRPEFKAYSKEILTVWDEIHPSIMASRHFGPELGVMGFTPEFRDFVFSD